MIFDRRKDLIRQIRAIVRVSTVTAEPYDPSEPPRHGILDEMSLAELRERYQIEKATQERKRAEKRDFILDEKVLINYIGERFGYLQALYKFDAHCSPSITDLPPVSGLNTSMHHC